MMHLYILLLPIAVLGVIMLFRFGGMWFLSYDPRLILL